MMKLSVLIPTYNYKCYTLVADLHEQLERSGVEYEILVADDGSKDRVSVISNLRINDLEHCQYILRQENVGRAAIRNWLADNAKGEWLMFMDSDGCVTDHGFVKKYLSSTDNADVVCGGWSCPNVCPSPDSLLRWKYERSYLDRLDLQNAPFRSFCFVIRRDVFNQVKFSEEYNKYGMEDARLGIDLHKKDAIFSYIDNPLMIADFETNKVFLHKTEEALQTMHEHRRELGEDAKMIQFTDRLSQYKLLWVIKFVYHIARPFLRHNLLGGNPNMTLFAFYKLGYYASL